MNGKEIIIPYPNSIKNWLEFIEVNRINKSHPPERILFNFINANYILPYQISSLACLIEEYYNFNCDISFICNNSRLCDYLREIRLFEYWNGNIDRNNFTPNNKATSLCLWQIDKSMIDNYAPTSQSYFEKNFLDGKDLESLNIALAEAMNNVCDHSESEVKGYTISQIYPKIGVLRTSICDFGIGIVNKIRSSIENQIDDIEAIKKALVYGFTTKSHPQNAGRGLPNLKDNVIGNHGDLRIYTNNIGIDLNEFDQLTVLVLDQPFNGTLIDIQFKTDNFALKDEDLINFDDIW